MAISEKSLGELKADAEQSVREYNEALKKGDLKAMTAAENDLKQTEKDYLGVKENQVFSWLKGQPDPVMSAVVQRSFPTLRHVSKRDNGVLIGIEIDEQREVQIDLVKFCRKCEKDTLWEYKVEKFGQMLCLRAAKELGVTGAQLKAISTSYFMRELSKKEELGQTPLSTNQVCKALQAVVNAIPFNEGTTLKVNNHDVAYLLACYTRRGKEALSVQVAKAKFVHTLLVDVCHRAATGKVYTVEFKQARAKVEPAAPKTEVSEPKKVSDPKAEAPKAEAAPLKVSRKKAA